MSFSLGLSRKIQERFQRNDFGFTLSGINFDQWIFLYKTVICKTVNPTSQRPHILVFSNQDQAESAFERLKKDIACLYFPSDESSPYSSLINSEQNLGQRIAVLDEISNTEFQKTLICTTDSLFRYQCSKDFIFGGGFSIEPDLQIDPQELSRSLVALGFEKKFSVDEPGTFSQRGEIFDIWPYSFSPIRIHYFDDIIEDIFEVEPETLKTLRSKPVSKLRFGTSPHKILHSEYLSNLRSNLAIPQPSFKNKYSRRKEIFDLLHKKELFENYTNFFSFFFGESNILLDFYEHKPVVFFYDKEKQLDDFQDYYEGLVEEFSFHEEDFESYNLLPHPENLYSDKASVLFNSVNIKNVQLNVLDDTDHFPINFVNTQQFIHNELGFSQQTKSERRKNICTLIKKLLNKSYKVFFSYSDENNLSEFKHLLEVNNITPSHLEYIHSFLDSGFFYQTENVLVVSDADVYSAKRKKVRKSRVNPDLFAEQMATLKIDDFVIHRDHGTGRYKGLESINLGGNETDFLVIEFKDQDKVYVPVYKINLIQKHADSNAEIKVSDLKSKRFSLEKNKARNSVKRLAFDLIKLQAERKSKETYDFKFYEDEFAEFEHSFPFKETPDQAKAVNDIIEDLKKPHPMERLICGDVGFGKTEVAMRAAYLNILNNKQVAILVPTTVLSFQHFQSFQKRFKDFPVKIDYISRFKKGAELKKTLHKLESGQIDIIIGTHKLLSKDIHFKDLGLLIIDEEHRFGVGHKEKLKLIKNNVDCITMTATPIPRTLQLSFLGIRDLSLIQTPPPNRQAIKTNILREDKQTIRDAIQREIKRGGQVFYVHNRVMDIQRIADMIQELVPEGKVVIGHGQLTEIELEKRMKKFYEGESNILLSTTIIESGIDIPTANTMIINKADRFGLAQLHQLRGRIGRSDKKAYAYLIIPQNRKVSPIAEKRLKAMQTFADIGSGFAIASSDLEIRGAGDILGAEQSGHISQIGLELYMELLQEAVQEIQGGEYISFRDIDIQTGHKAYIPEDYIFDPGTRLKTYKRISNTQTKQQLEEISEEITDIFGECPEEVKELFFVIELRNLLQKSAVGSLRVRSKSLLIKLDRTILDKNTKLKDKTIDYFISQPKRFRLSPNYSVECSFSEQLNQESLKSFILELISQTSSDL